MDNDEVNNPKPGIGRPLYLSHFLSTWNSRAFEFGAVLFLATVYPGTLLPMSIYALMRAAAAICLAGLVGRYIDYEDRLQVVRLSIICQRLAVAASCAVFWLLLQLDSLSPPLKMLAFCILAFLACIEKLASIMNTVAVERDWVVVIAKGDEQLREMNSQMRRIDLFCKLVAPLSVALIDSWSSTLAVLVTLIFNIVSICLEYPAIAWVFRKEPALARQKSQPHEQLNQPSEMFHPNPRSAALPYGVFQKLGCYVSPAIEALRTYHQSSAFLPSLALSCLYLTVLSFSGQMTTFLLALAEPHFSSASVGALRTVSATFEISATFLAPRVMSRIGPVRAGIWFLSWQVLCLTSAVGILWSQSTTGAPEMIYVFITCVTLSRVGLWSFDLCAQILIQESIEPHHRGSFSATEQSLQNFFELCTFATTIAFPEPERFQFPALLSLLALYVAATLYAKFVRDRRGHLLHMPPCLKSHHYQPLSVELDER